MHKKIEKIKELEKPPKVLKNLFNKDEIKEFLDLYKNLPYNDSFDTNISFNPSLASFFAVKKLIFSPNLITIFLVLASTTSSEKFLAL